MSTLVTKHSSCIPQLCNSFPSLLWYSTAMFSSENNVPHMGDEVALLVYRDYIYIYIAIL